MPCVIAPGYPLDGIGAINQGGTLTTYNRISQRIALLITVSITTSFLVVSTANAQETSTLPGEVVSSSRNTLTVRTADSHYQLFGLDGATKKPATIPAGSQVRVTSSGEGDGVRSATEIVVIQTAPGGSATTNAPVVPPEVRRVERDIERQARRFQFGVRAGVALDPELVLIGVQSQVGPFFGSNIYFRPNVEFAYGEVTALFALNPEVVYRLPLTSRSAAWSTYFGIGPGFNFLHQNFDQTTGSGKRVDFGQFHSDVGLTILGGVRYRRGMFMELKTSVYSDPSPNAPPDRGLQFLTSTTVTH